MTYQESNTLVNKKPKVVSKITVSKGGVLNSNLSFSLENPPQGTPGEKFAYMDNWTLVKPGQPELSNRIDITLLECTSKANSTCHVKGHIVIENPELNPVDLPDVYYLADVYVLKNGQFEKAGDQCEVQILPLSP